MQALGGHRSPMRSLAFSRDGALLAGGALDGKVVVWDMATQTVVQDISGSATAVNALAFDGRNGDQLFVGNGENRISTWAMSRRAAR
jgi:WD40 repeat protein